MKKLKWTPKMSFLIVAMTGLVWASAAQAQSANRGQEQEETPHYKKLWNWLQDRDYKSWKAADGGAVEFQEGQSPHGALLKTYVNSVVRNDLKNLPDKSVIVKENYNPQEELVAITIMQRAEGYDAEHGNWYYAKYLPDGTIARTPPDKGEMPIAGKFQSCINCHSGADGGDYAFLND